tara:strand:+ start:1322 stop:2392 length:1071 start_codon:yes stop_codon:yes gene_type:complete
VDGLDSKKKEAIMPSIYDIEVSDLPKNRHIVTTDGVEHKNTLKIKFDQIIIPVDKAAKKTNSARQGDEDGKHIADLRYSFLDRVDVNQPPPSVEILREGVEENGVVKFYRLLDGHHRYAALCDHVKEYIFDVYEIDPVNELKARTTLQLKNNNHSPQKKSSDQDIIANGTLLMKKEKFHVKGKLDTDLISEWITEVGSIRKNSDRNKSLVTKICNSSGVHLPYKNYVDKSAERWFRANMEPECTLHEDGGHWWIMEKAPDRSFIRMLKKETDQTQYIILNPKPTSEGNVKIARQNLYDYIHGLAKKVCIKFGGNPKDLDKVFKIAYALPQLRDSENMEKPIVMDGYNDDDKNKNIL